MTGRITLNPVLTGTADKDGSQSRLKGVCAEFEAIFTTYLLKSMRKTVVETGLLGNSNESKIYKSMFDEKLAIQISRSGGIGLGKVLFERLKNENLGASPRNEGTEERGYGGARTRGNRPLATPYRRPSLHEMNSNGLPKSHTELESSIETI